VLRVLRWYIGRRGERALPFGFKLIDGVWPAAAPVPGQTIVSSRTAVFYYPDSRRGAHERRSILRTWPAGGDHHVALLGRPHGSR